MHHQPANLEQPLLIVSGKGGVGKSLVASAMATRFARAGKKTILASLDADPHPYYKVRPSHKPREIEDNLDFCYLDARQSLKEYVRRKMSFPLLYLPALENPGVVKFLDALPLFSELMSLGKLYDLVGDESPYERVVFDAPATGHCRMLLNVPLVATNTLVAGPIYSSAMKIKGLLQDPVASALVIVTLAEETPAREAQELFEFATTQINLNCPSVLVNRCVENRFSAEDLAALTAWVTHDANATGLAEAAQFESDIAATQANHLEWLQEQGLPITVLPELTPTAPGAAEDPSASFSQAMVEQMLGEIS